MKILLSPVTLVLVLVFFVVLGLLWLHDTLTGGKEFPDGLLSGGMYE